ncbi:MAG: GSCFA domain-containing protein [Bacteroidales bacterium]|nr:GSCFA domain-containing protein [Bacteroidales bacterium]
MNAFRTVVDIQPSPVRITYSSAMLFMGSCFSGYIGEKLESLKFKVSHNPFGTLFNPASIADNLRILMINEPFSPEQLIYHNGQWISLNHYTGFSHPDQQICLNRINKSLALSSELLRKARFLFLTFGTAWIYKLNKTGMTVANCHKIPASQFTRHLLDPDEIITAWNKLLYDLEEFNADLSVVFTLSPVRHWKDGAVNNQKSKSILHYAIDKIAEQHPHVQYFPAYEIFMDEMRDYRFYATDMLHPSESGIAYTWNRFIETYIDEKTMPLMKEVQSIVNAARHRPVNRHDPANKNFIRSTIKAIQYFSAKHPFFDFHKELDALNNMLHDQLNI